VGDWEEYIGAVLDAYENPNGVAILTGTSGLFVIDIDVGESGDKKSGMEFWHGQVEEHGEPETPICSHRVWRASLLLSAR
jgi:hypothetical protein